MDAYSYDVFGSVRSHTGGANQPFNFAGEQADEELGLVYLRARYYDPRIGRFVNRDQFAGFAPDSLSLNRYACCRNDPTTLTDPTGEDPFQDVVALVYGVVDILAGGPDQRTTGLRVAEIGAGTSSILADATGHGSVAGASTLAGAYLSEMIAADELEAINRIPTQAELRRRLSESDNGPGDSPAVDDMVRLGIATQEWRTTTMGSRVASSVDTFLGAFPYFGIAYKSWDLPEKLLRIRNRFFDSGGAGRTMGVEQRYSRAFDPTVLALGGYGGAVGGDWGGSAGAGK